MRSTSVIADATWQVSGARAIDVEGRHRAGPVLIGPSAAVVTLRNATVVPLGGLATLGAEPPTKPVGRLVAAYDPDGTAWWIAAEAVWSDARSSVDPQRLCPVGVATGATTEQAMLLGISDRLGREAVCHLEQGGELPCPETPPGWRSGTLYDGRSVTGVPTAVVVGGGFARWAAGSTWDRALHRAVHGRTASDSPFEVADLHRQLGRSDLAIVGVDVGTPVLSRAGIARLSVQLVTRHDGLGRAWTRLR